MLNKSRYVFVVNGAAGTGAAPARVTQLLQGAPDLAARGRVLVVPRADALDALLQLAEDEVPVVLGGDGSLRALVTLLDARGELPRRTVAVIPFGTGNATAATLGIRSIADGLRALREGTPQLIDLLRTSLPQAPIALVSVSTGFESGFLERYGRLRYDSRLWAGLSALALNLAVARRDVSLTLDGTHILVPGRRVHNVGLYNIPHYAYGKVMWPGLAADDGTGVAAIVSSSPAYWALMARGQSAPPLGGSLARLGVRTDRWRAATLTAPAGLQVDGDVVAGTTAEVRVDPRALTALAAP